MATDPYGLDQLGSSVINGDTGASSSFSNSNLLTAGIGAAASFLAGDQLRSGAKEAATAGITAAKEGQAAIKDYSQQAADAITAGKEGAVAAQKPMADIGIGAAGEYAKYLQGYNTNVPAFQGVSQADLMADPSYIFRRNQGIEAVARGMNAKGYAGSGNMGTALIDYASNLASTEYGNVYNRKFQDYMTRWQLQNQREQTYMGGIGNLAGLGQTAASNIGTYNMNAGLGIGGVYTGAGQDIAKLYGTIGEYGAAGAVGGARAGASMWQGIGTVAGSYFGGPIGGTVGGMIGSML